MEIGGFWNAAGPYNPTQSVLSGINLGSVGIDLPTVFSSLGALPSANSVPQGTKGYVAGSGWYYSNGVSWTAFGTTPATSIGSIIVNPTGVAATDNVALANAYASAYAILVLTPDGGSYTGYITIVLGSGNFNITQNQAMMSSVGPLLKCSGLVFQGQGSMVTYITYNPATSGPLCQNQRWINVQFKGITFYGQDPNSDWMQSQEQGGVSNIQYPFMSDCQWNGQWRNIAVITGGNNNSEWSWNRCYVSTTNLKNWVYTPAAQSITITGGTAAITVVNTLGDFDVGTTFTVQTTLGNLVAGTYYRVVTATTSSITITTMSGVPLTPSTSGTVTFQSGTDQSVNHWFQECKFWSGNGAWLNMGYGGQIKIYQSDVSGWQPTSDTYLFSLLGNTHAYGVCFFLADGLRIEHKSDHALLMHHQWNQGQICFTQLDQSSQVQSRTATVNYFLSDTAQTAGPNIEFRQCQLIGTHTYNTGSSNYQFQTKIIYRNCDILQWPQAATFCLWNNGTNSGGAPGIRFEDCRSNENQGSTGYKTVFDTDLFGSQIMGGITNVKTANLCGAQSNMPINSSSLQFLFPQNCALVRLRLFKAAGGNGGAYNIAVQSTDGTPVVYGSFTGANAAAAIYQTLDIFVNLNTATTWKFTITDLQGRTLSMLASLLVDYIW